MSGYWMPPVDCWDNMVATVRQSRELDEAEVVADLRWWEDRVRCDRQVKRIPSLSKLSERWGWSVKRVRTILHDVDGWAVDAHIETSRDMVEAVTNRAPVFKGTGRAQEGTNGARKPADSPPSSVAGETVGARGGHGEGTHARGSFVAEAEGREQINNMPPAGGQESEHGHEAAVDRRGGPLPRDGGVLPVVDLLDGGGCDLGGGEPLPERPQGGSAGVGVEGRPGATSWHAGANQGLGFAGEGSDYPRPEDGPERWANEPDDHSETLPGRGQDAGDDAAAGVGGDSDAGHRVRAGADLGHPGSPGGGGSAGGGGDAGGDGGAGFGSRSRSLVRGHAQGDRGDEPGAAVATRPPQQQDMLGGGGERPGHGGRLGSGPAGVPMDARPERPVGGVVLDPGQARARGRCHGLTAGSLPDAGQGQARSLLPPCRPADGRGSVADHLRVVTDDDRDPYAEFCELYATRRGGDGRPMPKGKTRARAFEHAVLTAAHEGYTADDVLQAWRRVLQSSDPAVRRVRDPGGSHHQYGAGVKLADWFLYSGTSPGQEPDGDRVNQHTRRRFVGLLDSGRSWDPSREAGFSWDVESVWSAIVARAKVPAIRTLDVSKMDEQTRLTVLRRGGPEVLLEEIRRSMDPNLFGAIGYQYRQWREAWGEVSLALADREQAAQDAEVAR